MGTVLAVDPLNPSGAVIRYEEVQPGRNHHTIDCYGQTGSFFIGHALFSVVASGNNAGQVTVTGTLDRETTSTYSISIRVK